MAAPLKPQKVAAKGKDAWWAVPAIADMGAPTDDEVNAGTGLNITCYLLSDQDGVTANINKTQLPALLCEDSTTEFIDTVTYSLSDIIGVFDPQAAAASTGKKSWDIFKDGFTGYLVRRQGVANATEANVTIGQFVDVFKVETAKAVPGKTATDASGVYAFTAGVAMTDQRFNVAVVDAA